MALEKFGALWKGKPNSKAVLTGRLEDGRRILVFKNEDKKSDKHPDYRLVVDPTDVKGQSKQQTTDDESVPF